MFQPGALVSTKEVVEYEGTSFGKGEDDEPFYDFPAGTLEPGSVGTLLMSEEPGSWCVMFGDEVVVTLSEDDLELA